MPRSPSDQHESTSSPLAAAGDIDRACALIHEVVTTPPSLDRRDEEASSALLLHLVILEQALLAGHDDEVATRVEMVSRSAVPATWTPIIDAILDAVPRSTLRSATRQTGSLEEARIHLRRGGYDFVKRAFRTHADAVTKGDIEMLLESAIDDCELRIVEHVFATYLMREVPPEVMVRTADVMWRRFRDLLPPPASRESRFAEDALSLYLRAGAVAKAQRLTYQLLDLLIHQRSYSLWQQHERTLFDAFERCGLLPPDDDLSTVIEWALQREGEIRIGSLSQDDMIESAYLPNLIERVAERIVRSRLNQIGALS